MVRDAIDLGNMAALFAVGPSPMPELLPTTLQGTPDNMRVERTEYERLLTHGSNVLSRFDFVTKLQTTSDVGAIVSVLVAWGMRLYMIWMMKNPGKTPNLPLPLFGKRKQPPQEGETMEAPVMPDNGRPQDIDLSSLDAFAPGPLDHTR